MSSPPPKLTTWSRATVRQPFDAEHHNRLVRHANGELAAPQTWVADDGTTGLDWDPSVPTLTIGAELAAAGDLTVGGDLAVGGGLAVDGDVGVLGALAVDGPAVFAGPMTLGDLPADTIRVKGTLLLDVPLAGVAPPDNSVTSAKIVDGAIVNADVNAAAAIALSKLAAGAAGFVKSNGTVISAGNALSATDIPADTITATQLAADCVGASELADNSVVDANVATGAAIALAKLAHVGAGNVVRSNGTTTVAGQVVSGDIADGTIQTADLAAASVTQAGLSGNFSGSTTSSSPAAITGSDVVLTTAGGFVLVWASMAVSHSVAGGQVFLQVNVDGAAAPVETMTTIPVAGQQLTVLTVWLFTGLSAAAHTFRALIRTSGATATIQGGRLAVLEGKR